MNDNPNTFTVTNIDNSLNAIRKSYNAADITANTTLTLASPEINNVKATGSAISVTPPTTTVAGYAYTITKVDSSANPVTLIGSYNGVTNPTLSAQWKYMRFVTTPTTGVFKVISNN